LLLQHIRQKHRDARPEVTPQWWRRHRLVMDRRSNSVWFARCHCSLLLVGMITPLSLYVGMFFDFFVCIVLPLLVWHFNKKLRQAVAVLSVKNVAPFPRNFCCFFRNRLEFQSEIFTYVGLFSHSIRASQMNVKYELLNSLCSD